jgi:hypothetical protein
MNKMTIEVSGNLEIRLDGVDGVLGTLVISSSGLGFKAPNQRGNCTKQLAFNKIAPMIEAVGDPFGSLAATSENT